jgi:hypothetical protein
VRCEVWEVGRRGLDDEVQRGQTGGVDAEERRVVARVKAIHADTGQRDGSRRMAQPRQDEGLWVGRWQVMWWPSSRCRCRMRRRRRSER